jgi:hypothetical protein
VTAQPSAQVRFRRAIERRALWMAEDAARELPNLSLQDALQLVHLYAAHGSPRYERAAMEGSNLPPRLFVELKAGNIAARSARVMLVDADGRSRRCSHT